MQGRPRVLRRPDLGEWADDAACRRPNTPNMFPETIPDEARACMFCRRFCPVIDECREYGLSQGMSAAGVYGGLGEGTRERILRRRGRERSA